MKLQSATLGTALLLGALVATAPNAGAQPYPRYSPLLTNYWDCVISGGIQKGLAFLTFYEEPMDNGSVQRTFSGYQILSATPKASSSSSIDLRSPLGDIGRNTGGTLPAPPKTNLFGFTPVSGTWGYDYMWRIIGSYSLPVMYGTNVVYHPVSFIGKSSQGRSLTLVASTPIGRLTYSGRPYKASAAVDLSAGTWYATRKVNGQSFVEFFPSDYNYPDAEAYAGLGNYPGIFYTGSYTNTIMVDTNEFPVVTGLGTGPTYTTMGWTMLSSQKKIAFAFRAIPTRYDPSATNLVFTSSASYGAFAKYRAQFKSAASGIQEPSDRMSFTAFWQPNPVVTTAPATQ